MNILKKYWLRTSLTVLTFVFGLFMIVGAAETEEYTDAKEAQTTYWFQMNAAGDEPTTTQLTNPNSICPDKFEEADCARQYNASQTEVVGGVRQVKSAEVDNHIDWRTKP
ncbi:hypothetical protein H8B06_02965 [Sphingobacterium sp. DN00404]|uniref:Uncharacterized protein n=1 Tax=Sphingobacterium micropteri TaxID=2763501 RepID=A0ABR7YKR4_9SPHI|nr:hypothetical protein [Sphingobacterium micropteri]MBD1431773.1 hypothetical protein [Sphingobacterium micropteri]